MKSPTLEVDPNKFSSTELSRMLNNLESGQELVFRNSRPGEHKTVNVTLRQFHPKTGKKISIAASSRFFPGLSYLPLKSQWISVPFDEPTHVRDARRIRNKDVRVKQKEKLTMKQALMAGFKLALAFMSPDDGTLVQTPNGKRYEFRIGDYTVQTTVELRPVICRNLSAQNSELVYL